MQFILTVNQVKALEWGLNAQQALLFSFVYSAPSWAKSIIIEGKTFYMLSKAKIAEEIPLLTDKPDTAYRLLKALELVEVVELSSTSKITLVALTDKGRTWNTSEIYPSKVGNLSEVRSEIFPTNQDTNNQDTKALKNPSSKKPDSASFDVFWKLYPKKVSKADALKAWAKIKPELIPTIMEALGAHSTCEQWVKDDGQFIPNAATWLNKKKWEDEVRPYAAGRPNSGTDRQSRPSLVDRVRQANAHLLDDEPPAWEPGSFDAEFERIDETDGSFVGADDRNVRAQVGGHARRQ